MTVMGSKETRSQEDKMGVPAQDNRDFKTVDDLLQKACQLLSEGKVIAIPTETVYGLAADSSNDASVARIYEIKQRPSFNPLIVHVANLEQALQFGVFSKTALKLAEAFWHPHSSEHKPLTLVTKIQKGALLSRLATAGLDTVGIRVPGHPLTQKLLERYSNALVAPSANLSQRISATTADIVKQSLGNKVPLILDGGPCCVGVESTILDVSLAEASKGSGEAANHGQVTLLRFGGTAVEDIARVLGYIPQEANLGSAIKAPGMMKRHYAPSIPLKMNQEKPSHDVAYLGFGSYDYGPYNLSKTGDLTEAATHLFQYLFVLDNPKRYKAIFVAPIPHKGLGLAINDRLQRASADS